MTWSSLRALTWGTVTGAVASALLLAASESGLPELSRRPRADQPATDNRTVPPKQRPARATGAAPSSARTSAGR